MFWFIQCLDFNAFFSHSGVGWSPGQCKNVNSRWCACPYPSLGFHTVILGQWISSITTPIHYPSTHQPPALSTTPPPPSTLQHLFSSIHLTLNILRILTAKIFRQMVQDKFHFIFRLICGQKTYFVYFLCYHVTGTGGKCHKKPIRHPYKTSGRFTFV